MEESKEVREYRRLLDKGSDAFQTLRHLPSYGKNHWDRLFHQVRSTNRSRSSLRLRRLRRPSPSRVRSRPARRSRLDVWKFDVFPAEERADEVNLPLSLPFARSQAFKTFARLWKFQQDHRDALTEAGLKRWEIGEIASRIGQLYYNFYLCTSDTRFLREAHTFYDAIRARGYFADCHETPALALKQLRYQARHILVCVLLDKGDAAMEALDSWQTHIETYARARHSSDAAEWHAAAVEARAFVAANFAPPAKNEFAIARGSRRMDPARLGVSAPEPDAPSEGRARRSSGAAPSASGTVNVGAAPAAPLHLGGVVLCSHYTGQVRFNELTLDAFRMMRACEWDESAIGEGEEGADGFAREATTSVVSGGGSGSRRRGRSFGGSAESADDWGSTATSGSGGPGESTGGADARVNAHKYLVRHPSPRQLLLAMSTAVDELPVGSALLVYISARAPRSSGSRPAAGLCLSPAAETGNGAKAPWAAMAAVPVARDATKVDPGATIYPSDMVPFTRRSLFLVVDADASRQFLALSEPGGQIPGGRVPVVLCAPPRAPPRAPGATQAGSFFTLFLTSPLAGLCALCGPAVTAQVSPDAAAKFAEAERATTAEWLAAALASPLSDPGDKGGGLDPAWARMLSDPFLRMFVARFAMCRAMIVAHASTNGEDAFVPACSPPLPAALEPEACAPGVLALARAIGCEREFNIHIAA